MTRLSAHRQTLTFRADFRLEHIILVIHLNQMDCTWSELKWIWGVSSDARKTGRKQTEASNEQFHIPPLMTGKIQLTLERKKDI